MAILFYYTVRTTHIQGNVLQAPALLAHHFASILRDKAPTAIATYSPLYEERFAWRNNNSSIEILTFQEPFGTTTICPSLNACLKEATQSCGL